jgi:isopropylmalate/homocitrate/citramalate synthase
MPPQHIRPPRGLSIVDCTLREGEQFAHAAFSSEQRIEIARRLAAFGVAAVAPDARCVFVAAATVVSTSPRTARRPNRVAARSRSSRRAGFVLAHDSQRRRDPNARSAHHALPGGAPPHAIALTSSSH